MRPLLVLWAAAWMASVSHAASDLFCSCQVDRQPIKSLAVHCLGGQENDTVGKCVKAPTVDLIPGFLYVPGYALVKLFRTYRLWADAVDVCKANGARLAVPRDSVAIDGLKQVFNSEPYIGTAFIGLTDKKTEGLFVDTEGEPATFLTWRDGEPNNAGNYEHCVSLGSDGKMNDMWCLYGIPFFCERRLSSGVPADYRWLSGASRFYKAHADAQTYPQAAETCRKENASLAVPDTWRRAEAILRLIKPDNQQHFLGLTDEASEGDFVTATGRHLRDMEFQDWKKGEPDNNYLGNPENCLTISGQGYLNDYHCETPLPFICEILPV